MHEIWTPAEVQLIALYIYIYKLKDVELHVKQRGKFARRTLFKKNNFRITCKRCRKYLFMCHHLKRQRETRVFRCSCHNNNQHFVNEAVLLYIILNASHSLCRDLFLH